MSSSTPNSSGAGAALPLRSALKTDDDSERSTPISASGATKAVQIAEPEPEPEEGEETQRRKRFSAGLARRLAGRPPAPAETSSRSSIRSASSLEALNSLAIAAAASQRQDGADDAQSQATRHRHRPDLVTERLLAQVAEWIHHERTKKHGHRFRRGHSHKQTADPAGETAQNDGASGSSTSRHDRRYSIDSQSSDVSFDRLQRIVDDSMTALGLNAIPHPSPRLGRRSHGRRRSSVLHRAASSDTDFLDGDALVPTCDAVLDNSKAMSMTGGSAGSMQEDTSKMSSKERKEREAWLTFKNEVIRLTHTLRLKGWRRVPLDGGDLISICRLSGALTNAVYVVTPPEPEQLIQSDTAKKRPAKLLLRVYGPQADSIIDREHELNVLKRLARKKIGARLLGTFTNGRFEEFLNALALTSEALREPDTSKQIAKRMRELHDGIELLREEREGGPAVLNNFDCWLPKVQKAALYLDSLIAAGKYAPLRGCEEDWKVRGFVCGVEWPKFLAAVERYRRHLSQLYGQPEIILDQLVFAHSDTQYGNILRVQPDDDQSPLLQENYKHKQLVVIDFEYSAANTRGLEFANHFTEWCYNYHDERKPYSCNVHNYPKPDEQRRFLKAYVNHRPEYPHPGASTPNLTPLATPTIGPAGTPSLSAATGSSSSIVEFMLDARVPAGGWKEEEKRRDDDAERQIEALLEEIKLWRVANSAMWIAWGIMQSNIAGFDMDKGEPLSAQECQVQKEEEEAAAREKDATARAEASDKGVPEDEEVEAEEEFDYLAYTHERALFFWGDCVEMGLVKEEELPASLVARLKRIKY
ncbi:kinase-like domain-containing protein [Microdochium trichocladiopsis]|uniref:Kinase-like domain-containing protein n=1 Tax=Microdochium trichocladiopsis TaxID=1682393 RepID=A0A9P8YEK2_9PEZI|nr:kinase-like domain-containing protein [Microdochium trichocladiopsis]KAH7037462.1 kinase-like domain-containing protein [Microdochium trichocladiopsis]